MPMPEMDSAYASEMREEGIGYKEIGVEIARREGREHPYQAQSVLNAVQRFRKLLARERSHGT